MDRAQTLMPVLSLDPKRIAATSVAITIHALVLMVLLLPTRIAPSTPIVDNPMIVVPDFKTVPPVIPVTPPRPHTEVAPRRPVQQSAPAVDSTPSPIDPTAPPATPESEPIDSFQPALPPAFVQISADVAPPPPYPAQALRRGLGGVVILKIRVNVQGRPVEAVVETSSGSNLLDSAALKFVLARWHFVPATQSGVAIEAYALVPISFVIER